MGYSRILSELAPLSGCLRGDEPNSRRRGVVCDGIFAEADWLALGCYKALEEHGISVPEQVKIVGYDDISVTAFNSVPLTTIHQQVDKIGALAAEHLPRILDGKEEKEHVIKVPVYLVPRESTRGKI